MIHIVIGTRDVGVGLLRLSTENFARRLISMPSPGDKKGRQESAEKQRSQGKSPVSYPCWEEDLREKVAEMNIWHW